MLSFVGWEAVAPLTTRFRDPDRQLPRVIGTAFAVTAVLYLALAMATIAVLGPAAGTDVPLASLLARAVGTAGPVAAAVAAVVLTLGAVNAYLSGAAAMARQLAGGRRGAGNRPILAASALAGLVVIGLYAAHLVGTAQLIGLPTALFLVVYLGCTVSAARILHGRVRAAAVTAALAVLVVLTFCGWPLLLAAAVAATAAHGAPRGTRYPARRSAGPNRYPLSNCGRNRTSIPPSLPGGHGGSISSSRAT
jgi:amino acid efflux transporter